MAAGFLNIATTRDVLEVQDEMGSAVMWGELCDEPHVTEFSASERAMIESRDSFYMATVSQTGWPYIQHRGGPVGFLKVIDERTLAMADYRGNRQYITSGNLRGNMRACLFLMDYPSRTRLKIYVRVEVVSVDDDPELLAQVAPNGYRAKVERIYLLRLEAFDWNCPQHITPRYTAAQVAEHYAKPMKEQIAALEQENSLLRAQLERRGESK
ncbi:phosphatase [Salmonella enterica subsp. enterica serovar Choleraesuis]|nr:phosphatase [Salmonella enterica subsp. enterica serovar Choleraesuis]